MWVMRLWARAYNTFISPRRGAADHNLQCDFTAAIWGHFVQSCVENSNWKEKKKSYIPYRSRCYFQFPGNNYCGFPQSSTQLHLVHVNMFGSVPCVNWYSGAAISQVFCLYCDLNLQAAKCLCSRCPVSLPLKMCNSSGSLPIVAIHWSMRQFSSVPPWRNISLTIVLKKQVPPSCLQRPPHLFCFTCDICFHSSVSLVWSPPLQTLKP